MRQQSKTEHQLEVRHRPESLFFPACGSWPCLRPAAALADQGRLQEAIDLASDLWIAKYGQMHGVTFRVVTRTIAISFVCPFGDAGDLPER